MKRNNSVFVYIPDYHEVEYYSRLAGNTTSILKKEGKFPIELSFNLGELINEYGLGKVCLRSVILLNNLKGYVDDNIITEEIGKMEFNITDYNPKRGQYIIPISGLEKIVKITTGVKDSIGKIHYIDTGPELFVGIKKNNLHQIDIHKY